jgi:hypothetical protein
MGLNFLTGGRATDRKEHEGFSRIRMFQDSQDSWRMLKEEKKTKRYKAAARGALACVCT